MGYDGSGLRLKRFVVSAGHDKRDKENNKRQMFRQEVRHGMKEEEEQRQEEMERKKEEDEEEQEEMNMRMHRVPPAAAAVAQRRL